MKSSRYTFFIALLVAFVDHMGVGLVYPLFSAMLFDNDCCILPVETSIEFRGMWLGLLIALMPLIEFFAAPFWGALSDTKGRKIPLQMSISIALIGYIIAFVAAYFTNIFLLLSSRVIIGFAAGNISIVQAAVADLSKPEEKTKNFGLYAMALGAGFALGPFFGGFFSHWGYSVPFLVAVVIVAINLGIAILYFKETHLIRIPRKLTWFVGFDHFKKAFRFKGLRVILMASFLHCFAWSYFFEFVSVYLIGNFNFTSKSLGLFYGLAGASYAVSTGYLIRPFTRWFKPHILFLGGNLLTGLAILSFAFITSQIWIWVFIFLICFFVAFVWPSATSIVSNHATGDIQGESLGILGSVNALGYVLSPLLSGSFIGKYPSIPMWVGGSISIIVALILFRTLKSLR